MSATITGVCGLSWEVTMAVLPRLYLKEVVLELQRRKIAVGRDKTLQKQELTHLLQEVMVCEYEQLQQHLKGKITEVHSPQTRAQDVTTSDGQGAPYVHNHHGNTSQCSPNQEMMSPISSEAQQNVQAQLAQTRAKNTLQGNLMTGTQVSNATQSVVQNSQNQAVEPTSHATTVTQQNLRTELEAQFAQSRAKNTLQGIPSHTAQGVVQNSPHQVVETISHMTAMQQTLQAQLAQAVAEYKQNSPRMKPSSYTGPPHTGPPVHGNSFTIGQSDRLQMQVSPQIQQSPQAVPPQPTQVIRNGLAEIAKLSNLPAKLLPADENTLGKFPFSLVSQTSPQLPPQSQTVAQGGLLIQDRTSSSGMHRQSEVVLPQSLHKGVATNGVHSNTAPSMAQSSPNQLVQGVSFKPAGQQPSTGTQCEANNALPGTRMPASIHKEQGNMFKNSVSNSNTQTLQAFSMHENTSPYIVGQGNLMIESTEARNMKPGHQDVQGTLYNSDTTRDISFQSTEREKDGYTNKRSTNTPIQTSLASQQMLLAPNQQLESENFSRTDSTMQQSPGQDSSQSTLHGESSVQDPSETENTNNSLPANVVVKVERDDDFWPVSCTTSAANIDNSGIPESPSVVVKTETDDSAETGSTLPVDYSVRMEESTARTDNNMEGEFREDYASPEHSPVTSSTPVQQTMPQNVLMTHTEHHDPTPTAMSMHTLPLTEPLSVGTSLSQENGYGSTGFPSPDVTAYVSRVSMVSTRQYQAQKRKTVRALLDDLKRAKQLKTDGLTDEDDPMGIVSAMRDRREVRRNESRTNRGADVHVGPSVQPVLVQQQRTGNMQVQQEGLAPQFPMAATEANRKVPGFKAATLHKCMFCPFETRLKTNLQYHLRDHADINVYRCGKCSFSAATKQTLDNHAATQHHEELPFMCGVCGYRTGVKDNLSTHMWVVHRAGKGFQCSLCDYRTSYKSRLETHMINHHF